ncbi:MAG: hypothetical protein K1X88_13675 [Nannocystaceae bacterium]|nr:hypothetical protein [Nannocystaceae bacterium]
MRLSSALFAVALLPSTVPMAGCAMFGISLDRTGRDADAGRYRGPECDAFELHEQTAHVYRDGKSSSVSTFYAPQPTRTDPLPLQVAKLACGDAIAQYAEDGGASAIVHALYGFDMRRFDHVAAAVAVTMCGLDSNCVGPDPPNTVSGSEDRDYAAGMLSTLSQRIDPARVSEALTEAGVGVSLRDRFLARLATTRAEIDRRVAAMPEAAAAVLVTIPTQVWQAREAEGARNPELWARFDAAAAVAAARREAGVGDEAVAELADLRRAWVAACGELACARRSLGVAIARELLLAHVSRGDALSAQAELALAQPEPPIEAVLEIDARQAEAMAAATDAHRTQASLRDQGLDAGTARAATRGTAAYDFSSIHRFAFERARGVQWAGLAGEPREHFGTLRAKKTRGDAVVLQFDDIVTKYADEVCRDTGRVERIESDGRLVYGQRCRATGKTNVDRRPVAPVVVPAREAKSLQPGDTVRVVVAPGDEPQPARVLSASRKDALVQVRDVRAQRR